MAAIPKTVTSPTVAAIYKSYEDAARSGHRPHLGASIIGHPCDRHLWMVFRWIREQEFDGRMLRLFETGQKEEQRLVSDLRRIGVEVRDTQDDNVTQWTVSGVAGHFGGSIDAAARGFPEAPKTWSVCEFKTANTKSFKELQAKGVRSAKPLHWHQMQTYCHLTGMERAVYLVKCKDTDELYMERVHYDRAEAEKIVERARRIITAAEPPIRISNDPSLFTCKWCQFHGDCHGTSAPEPTCRSCAHSTPEMDGDARWSCARHKRDLSVKEQLAGCPDHLYIPPLLERFATPIDGTDDRVHYRLAGGGEFVNGQPPAFTSIEIRAVHDKVMLGDKTMQHVKATVPSARAVA